MEDETVTRASSYFIWAFRSFRSPNRVRGPTCNLTTCAVPGISSNVIIPGGWGPRAHATRLRVVPSLPCPPSWRALKFFPPEIILSYKLIKRKIIYKKIRFTHKLIIYSKLHSRFDFSKSQYLEINESPRLYNISFSKLVDCYDTKHYQY